MDIKKFIESQTNLEPEFAKILDDNFMDLLADNPKKKRDFKRGKDSDSVDDNFSDNKKI